MGHCLFYQHLFCLSHCKVHWTMSADNVCLKICQNSVPRIDTLFTPASFGDRSSSSKNWLRIHQKFKWRAIELWRVVAPKWLIMRRWTWHLWKTHDNHYEWRMCKWKRARFEGDFTNLTQWRCFLNIGNGYEHYLYYTCALVKDRKPLGNFLALHYYPR